VTRHRLDGETGWSAANINELCIKGSIRGALKEKGEAK
jgi:hypothetical protein